MNSCLLSDAEGRRNVNYLASLDFIISLGFGLILPLFPLYVAFLGGGTEEVGLEVGILFSSFVLTRALLATPFGNLSDRVGRKRLILIGSFLYAFLAVLFTVPNTWIGLIFVRSLQGVASAMVWPVSEALVIDSCPANKRGASLGKIVMSSNLGMVLGPFVGAGLFLFAQDFLGLDEMGSYKFPFYITAAVSLAGAVFVWKYVTDARRPQEERKKVSFRRLLRPDGMDKLSLRNLNLLYANAAMEGFSFASIGPMMVLFLSFKFALTADYAAFVIGIGMGLGALVAFPSGRLADRIGKKKMFVLGGYIAFIGTILIPFDWGVVVTIDFALLATIIFLGMRSMAFQVASPALRAMQADAVPSAIRGRLIGMFESMNNIGSVVGGVAGGLLWDLFSPKEFGLFANDGAMIPFLVSGVMGLFTVSLVLVFVQERRLAASVD